MFKKIFLSFMLSFSVCQIAHAKFVVLNNHNADDCKHQLLASGDVKPIIFMDIKGLKLSENLQSVYKEISHDYPNKTFFMFNVDGKNQDDVALKTAQSCLNVKSLDAPYVYAYVVEPTSKKSKGYFIASDNMKLSDNSTKQDILKFLSL